MAKIYLNSLPEEQRIQILSDFYDMVSRTKNREEAKVFFRDLLTPDEMVMLIRRMEVAILLMKGFTFQEIKEFLKVGTDKICAVHRALEKNGQGYRLVGERMEKQKQKRKEQNIRTTVKNMDPVKRKYPGYFLINNLFDEIAIILNKAKEKRLTENEYKNNGKPYGKKR